MAEASPANKTEAQHLEAVEQLERQYRRTFGSEDGQAVLEDLAKYCHVFTSSFVAGDPHGTSVNEGMRSVFLLIMEKAGLTMTKLYRKRAELERTQDTVKAAP